MPQSRGCSVVTILPVVRCKIADSINQHQHHKQQDSGTMSLKSLVRTKFFLIAWIVTMFDMMTVYDRKLLKTQLALQLRRYWGKHVAVIYRTFSP